MKLSVKVKNRVIELNTDEDLSPVEVKYIETMIENEIAKLEKEIPDTLKILSTLVVKYCLEYFVANKKLKSNFDVIDKKIDEIIRVLKDSSNDSLF